MYIVLHSATVKPLPIVAIGAGVGSCAAVVIIAAVVCICCLKRR